MRKTGDPTSSTEAASTEAESGESFLGRWSRRKRATRGEVAEPSVVVPTPGDGDELPVPVSRDAPASEAADAAPLTADPAVDTEQAPVLTDADMPALDSLGDNDDYSGFLSSGVSEGLRKQALRRLFRSAHFNVLDGLNDYDDDFTTFEPLGDIVTSDMRYRMEEEAKKAAREAQEQALLADQGAAEAGSVPTSSHTAPAQLADDAGSDQLPGSDDESATRRIADQIPANRDAASRARDEADDETDDANRAAGVRDELPDPSTVPRSDVQDG